MSERRTRRPFVTCSVPVLLLSVFFSAEPGPTREPGDESAAVPDSIEVSRFIDTGAAGWALKKNDVAYRVEVNGCRIQWNVVEHRDDPGEYHLYSTSDCSLPLSSRMPMHRAILAKIVEEWEPEKIAGMSWGSFGSASANDWSWSIPIAMASAKSAAWNEYLEKYPDVTRSANEIFVELAKETGACGALRSLFEEFGLLLELQSVEKVFALEADELPFRDELERRGLEGNPKLMYDAAMTHFTIRLK